MESTVIENDDIALDLLLEKVYRDKGHDFREYKRGTVMRRLERRLHATGARTYFDYMRFLDIHPEEYQKFADDLTLKISDFFRSQYTFHQVAKLAREAEICYAVVACVTDYDSWHERTEPVTIDVILRVQHQNIDAAKQIIEKHSGQIWVESKYGRGSRFTFTLPLATSK